MNPLRWFREKKRTREDYKQYRRVIRRSLETSIHHARQRRGAGPDPAPITSTHASKESDA